MFLSSLVVGQDALGPDGWFPESVGCPSGRLFSTRLQILPLRGFRQAQPSGLRRPGFRAIFVKDE
jgi:hypothetical protein